MFIDRNYIVLKWRPNRSITCEGEVEAVFDSMIVKAGRGKWI